MENFEITTPKYPKLSGRQLHVSVPSDRIQRFFGLLSQGIIVPIQKPCSVADFLCRCLGMQAEYVENRIQTIFLNGKAVDDISSTFVEIGASVALSASMPGLAGSTLRRGGYYAAMRRQISQDTTQPKSVQFEGLIVVKLFNLVQNDLGRSILQQGIWIRGNSLQNFFKQNQEEVEATTALIELNGDQIEFNYLANIDWGNEIVFLKLQIL